MRLLKKSTNRNVMVFMTDAADNASGLAGLTLTITASKDGGAFSSISPTVTDRGSGWYSLALDTTMTNTEGDLALHITATGAVPTDIDFLVLEALPGTLTPASIQGIWDALTSALTTSGSIGKRIVDYLTGDVFGRLGAPAGASVSADIAASYSGLASGIAALPGYEFKKNQALAGFTFPMYDALGQPKTGLTVTTEISQDGGAFASTSNSASEISDGWYTIDLTSGEMNAKVIAFKATGSGARQLDLVFNTQD